MKWAWSKYPHARSGWIWQVLEKWAADAVWFAQDKRKFQKRVIPHQRQELDEQGSLVSHWERFSAPSTEVTAWFAPEMRA
jgi:hypothetical protein